MIVPLVFIGVLALATVVSVALLLTCIGVYAYDRYRDRRAAQRDAEFMRQQREAEEREAKEEAQAAERRLRAKAEVLQFELDEFAGLCADLWPTAADIQRLRVFDPEDWAAA